jgi:xylose isomerase
MAAKRVKNSVGIWAFGGNATRFMPGGYQPEAGKETMFQRTERAVAGLSDIVDGFEYHYPGEVNEKTLGRIQALLGSCDIHCIALGLFSDPKYSHGSFINPSLKIRKEVRAITRAGIELASDIGAKFIIWPGSEGYNYPFQVDYGKTWEWFVDGIADAAAHCADYGVTMLLEHKNSEPAMRILMRDIGMTLFTIQKVKDRGVPTDHVLVNMDWQHLIMNGEPLAEYAALLASEGKLGHQHGNSGWGSFDDDNMVGASFFMQTLGLAVELQRVGYGANGERVGYDLFPYTENQVDAVRRSVLQWEFIWDLARRLDKKALNEAQSRRDAVACYEEVFRVLGLDKRFIAKVIKSRKGK